MVKLSYVILYVADVAAAIRFYVTAFGFVQKLVTPDNSYGELLTGETTLSFASLSLARSNFSTDFQESNPNQNPFGQELGFTTHDVPAVLEAAVAAGAVVFAEPVVKPWGQTVAYLRDPNGFLIEICTPIH